MDEVRRTAVPSYPKNTLLDAIAGADLLDIARAAAHTVCATSEVRGIWNAVKNAVDEAEMGTYYLDAMQKGLNQGWRNYLSRTRPKRQVNALPKRTESTTAPPAPLGPLQLWDVHSIELAGSADRRKYVSFFSTMAKAVC